MSLDLHTIRKRNLAIRYPAPEIDDRWEDPGASLGIHKAYRYPSWDTLQEGWAPACMEVTDHTIIRHDGLFHLFCTCAAPGAYALWEGQHHYITHATTPNLVDWALHRPVLWHDPQTPHEESHIWPPFVFRYEDRFAMIYCGMNRQDSQCLCLAFSTDLFRWERSEGNPIIGGDLVGDWARHREDGSLRHCRDPHVIKYRGYYLVYYTAHAAEGYAAVGLAASEDLQTWHDLGPCYRRDASAPWLTESPLIAERDDLYYLLPSQSPGITCFVSKDPTDFHHRERVPVRGIGLDPRSVVAPEIAAQPEQDTWIMTYHTSETKRHFVAIMHWEADSIVLERVLDGEQLRPLVTKLEQLED